MQSRPVLALLCVVTLVFAWSVLRFWNKMAETSRNRKMAEDKVAELRKQKEKLSADIDSLSTDEGKEKIFRENFGLAKEGEDVIIVVEDKNPPEPQKTSFTSSFFSFFKNLFDW
ncbi:MAG: hypothetical protein UW02_C0009G0020 [Candidatus Nomurabacteria bacterium GW2011_GWB1_43_7]|uniref:Septum formation initiator n=3 Tax=Candidatus Nomuraibacteriota TaxID=1752729 RepID=A0A0G1HIL6_9BACT|nr:MAG: hypothetical protein UW02_C0009G0020 [Candidatus Nomurabacteria bacterium GW2011_GWB1_43_7]